jgi:conjugal transfer pilus assembly protein TraE
MLFGKYKGALDQMTSDKRAWQIIGVFSSMTAFALAGALLVVGKGTEKTIITPPVVTKTFWVDGSEISPEYVEQMAIYFAHLALDSNPSNVKYKNEMLLQHVTPGAYGALRNELEVAGDKLVRDNASQTFYPSEVRVVRKMATMAGKLATIIGDKVTSYVDAIFQIEFVYEGGRLYVASFKPVEKTAAGL